MAYQTRGERGHRLLLGNVFPVKLDLSYEEVWECPGDYIKYKKRLENERVFEFLAGLNRSLDDVRGRILGRKPLPSIREVFAEMKRKEGRQEVMMKDGATGVGDLEMSALLGEGGRATSPHQFGLNGGLLQFGQAGSFSVEPNGVGPNTGSSQMGQNGISNFRPGSSQFRPPMLSQLGPTKNIELTSLLSKGITHGSGLKQQKGRPWCKHCRKPGHKADT